MSSEGGTPDGGWKARARSAAGVAAVVVLPACLIAAKFVHDGVGHDYLAFHGASRLIAAGENPFGVAEQIRAQRPLRQGAWGFPVDPKDQFDQRGYLPYFYAPWVAMIWAPVAAAGFPVGLAAWTYLGVQCLALSGYLLSHPGQRSARLAAVAASIVFLPCCFSLSVGQTPPLVLLGLVVAWRLLERGDDAWAGVALALLTFKPQLSVVAVPAALVWGARRGRWRVAGGFAAALALLWAASFCAVPDWPSAMTEAIRRTPRPSDLDPSLGATWLTVLRTFGFERSSLAAAYAALAVPAVVATLCAAWSRRRPASDVLAYGTLAAFAVSPYAMVYDYAVLVFPLALLLRAWPERTAFALGCVYLVVPYLQLNWDTELRPFLMFWLPVSVAMLAAAREAGAALRPATGPGQWCPFLWSAWQTRSITTAEARIRTSSSPGATSTP